MPAFTAFFTSQVAPVMSQTGATLLAWLQTEPAQNTFPALPVRAGENVFVWFSRLADSAGLSAHRDALARYSHWRTTIRPAVLAMLTGERSNSPSAHAPLPPALNGVACQEHGTTLKGFRHEHDAGKRQTVPAAGFAHHH